MAFPLRLAAAIALVALAGIGAVLYMSGSFNQTPQPALPSPTPSPAATQAGLDTSDWIAYTSERYGFDIKRPPNFHENPSSRLWQMADAANFPAEGTEDFTYQPAEDLGLRVSVWSVAVEPGASLGTWIEAYCVAQTYPCAGVLDEAVPTTIDGHAASSFAGSDEDSRIFALVNDRIYIVTAWRPDNDPSVAEFGGGRRLVEAFASTMTLRPTGPAPVAPAPALSGSFTSARYGFSIDYPGGYWTEAPSTYLWAPGEDNPDGWADRFLPPGVAPETAAGTFRVASAAIPVGVTPDDSWIGQNITDTGGECSPPSSTLGDIVIDGQTGKVRLSCEEIEATVVVGDRIYLFTLFMDPGGPFVTAGGRALFEAMIASVQLTPETAEVPASPAAS